METIVMKTDALNMTEEEFFNFCQQYEALQLQRNKSGEILLMEPTSMYISNLNLKIASRIEIWNEKSGLGYTFSSNTGFTLADRSVRSPDAAWIRKERYEALPNRERERFANISPDFVIELKSKSESLNQLRVKMLEWIANGCLLSWLIDPDDQIVYVYRKDGSLEFKSFEEKISGEDVLPGFELDLRFIRQS